MRVTALLMENFRGIRRLELDLDEITVLIGENNSGKTAVLDALRLCLGTWVRAGGSSSMPSIST